MFRFLLFSALAAVALGGVPKLRSLRPQLDGRIVGGEDIEIEEVPYQVSLLSYGSHICGGSIIGNKYVVTAGHCTDGSSASSLSVRVGSSIRNSGGEVIAVAVVHQHPEYDWWLIDFDVTVLELKSEISLGSAAQPVGLPEQNQDVPAGSDALVSGWGALTEGGSSPRQLQAVTVEIVSSEDCNAAYGEGSITENMICAGVVGGGKDACQGDSGGPLVVDGKLCGVVSWGAGCARPDYPGVYSSVPALREFILEKSGI